MSNPNRGYKRERAILKKIDARIKPVPFSGGQWQLGKEDGRTPTTLYQVKSTESQIIPVRWRSLQELIEHCTSVQVPVFVLDYLTPKIGEYILPDEQFVIIRLTDYQKYMLPHIQGVGEDDGSTDHS